MERYGIAMDLGTSGIRVQAVDLTTGAVLVTAVTVGHPLPGANSVDHLHFALEFGTNTASRILVEAANTVIHHLGLPAGSICRLGLCGNPVQLSLFQGLEVRDLAYAGSRTAAISGVQVPERGAAIRTAREIEGLALSPDCRILVPPAVCHAVGADALAMILQSGLLDQETCALATDFGTNAEMALLYREQIYTASAAAGPALEGQQISCGMLAAPGAIADLQAEGRWQRLLLLDQDLLPVPGPLVDLGQGQESERLSLHPLGLTGTGTVAVVDQGIATGLIALPRITTADQALHLGPDLSFSEADLQEAGKAIGAIRAAHLTLCHAAGIGAESVATMYMAGAAGTYVDPLKAQRLGMVPPRVRTVVQIGNTSLAMARQLVCQIDILEKMSELAEQLRANHCMLAGSAVFKRLYILELAHWTEGMPMEQYRGFLKHYGLPDLEGVAAPPQVLHPLPRDIAEFGPLGLRVVHRVCPAITLPVPGCVACLECIDGCPEGALAYTGQDGEQRCLTLVRSLCAGMACRRCERLCPEKVFHLRPFLSG